MISLPGGAKKKDRDKLTRLRPQQAKLDEIYAVNVDYWDALRQHIPELAAATDAKANEQAAGKFRSESGGHLLFRPVGQKPFTSAARVLIDRGKTVAQAVGALATVPMELSDSPWRGLFWDPVGRRVLLAKQQLAQNLMLHLIGEMPFPVGYELEKEYRSVLRDEKAKLPPPMQHPK